jgi:hypothetical protein
MSRGGPAWAEHDNQIEALALVLGGEWRGEVLLTSTAPSQERDSLCCALRIICKAGNNIPVFVGMPDPTRELVSLFRENGADDVWAVSVSRGTGPSACAADPSNSLSVTDPVCPALRMLEASPVELSVCGKRNNRLILVMRHFREWCLADYESCPYWRGEYGP